MSIYDWMRGRSIAIRTTLDLFMPLPFELQRNVSREEINELPIRRYEGEVRVVANAHELAPAMADILQETVVGFDTETRPSFRVGESYPPSLAQVATARAVYLFQVQRRDVAAAIAEMLARDGIVKAGVGLSDDLKALKKVIQFSEKSIVDLGSVALRQGLKQTGVRNLTGLFLGFRIPKGTKTSNWSRPRLSAQQITYAATDAWACRELYLKFRQLGLT
jgi:ribonuclease D